MKLKPIDVLFIVGLLLAILPWLILEKPDWRALAISTVGAILLMVVRADALTSIWGWGESGNDFLIDCWKGAKRAYRKIIAPKSKDDEGDSPNHKP